MIARHEKSRMRFTFVELSPKLSAEHRFGMGLEGKKKLRRWSSSKTQSLQERCLPFVLVVSRRKGSTYSIQGMYYVASY